MKRILIACLGLLLTLPMMSQGTVEEYKRAFSLSEKYRDKVLNANITPQWIGRTNQFWYVRQSNEGRHYVIVDAAKQERKELFDAQMLSKKLAKVIDKKVDAGRLNLINLRVANQLDTLSFVYDGRRFTYLPALDSLSQDGENRERPSRYWGSVNTERESRPTTSPDGKYEARVRDYNVWVKEVDGGEERALTTDGTDSLYYAASLRWSPDSRKLLAVKMSKVEVRQISFIESSPRDQLQPKIHTRDYPKPGDSLSQRIPVIFDLEYDLKMEADNSLFPHQYSLYRFDWSADSKTVMFEYNQRGHQLFRVLEMSALTGGVRVIIEEKSNTFVNYNRYFHRKLANGTESIWMSERDNWNHLYLYERCSGEVKRQITKGEYYVREIIEVDEEKREIIFSANGMVKDEDPYLVRYYRTGIDNDSLTCLTPDEGMHQAWFSHDKQYLVDTWSMVNKAPVTVLRDGRTGKVLMPLEEADISQLLAEGWIAPEPFVAKGRDGKTDIWGVIVRPTHFDPNKSYPVVEYIYAGPGSHYTPKSFFASNGNMSPLAELGFIVIQLDGMGTSFRSKAFEDVAHHNLRDAGFPDRILWLKAAAEKYPYIDSTRVGIFGASAGGQESMAGVLFHPEHYKAAYSSCGCHDNRMDKIWWNEQWLGFPIGEQYKYNSNVENAHLLTRPLMLVLGEVDDNVDPASTLQVCDALIRAGKDFEFVMLPGVGHTMGGSYGEHKRYDFFVKHLMKVLPPAWDEVKGK